MFTLTRITATSMVVGVGLVLGGCASSVGESSDGPTDESTSDLQVNDVPQPEEQLAPQTAPQEEVTAESALNEDGNIGGDEGNLSSDSEAVVVGGRRGGAAWGPGGGAMWGRRGAWGYRPGWWGGRGGWWGGRRGMWGPGWGGGWGVGRRCDAW